jgi:hypothetical protein
MLMAFLQKANHQKSPQQVWSAFRIRMLFQLFFFLIFVDFISAGSGLALEIQSGNIRANKCRSKFEHQRQNGQRDVYE